MEIIPRKVLEGADLTPKKVKAELGNDFWYVTITQDKTEHAYAACLYVKQEDIMTGSGDILCLDGLKQIRFNRIFS